MKVALVFLICFASLSYQQRIGYQRFFNYPQRDFFYPRYPYRNSYYQSSDDDLSGSQDFEDLVDDFDTQGRVQQKPEKRLFWRGSLFSSLLATTVTTSSTTTLYSTVSTTLTVATVQVCIPSSQFVAGSTTSCANRRRRDDRYPELQEPFISPSNVLPLTPSAAPASFISEETEEDGPQLWSSQEDAEEVPAINHRRGRAISTITVPVTFLSTVTSFSFTVTTVKKTVTVGAANGLSCIPSGYSVC